MCLTHKKLCVIPSPMTKERWRYLIRRSGLSLSQAYRDLNVASSTAWRWPTSACRPMRRSMRLLMVRLDETEQKSVRREVADGEGCYGDA